MSLFVYEYDDYRTYLRESLPVKGSERGRRSALSRRLKCRPAFISQVLSENSHFSLEQCVLISEFLEHGARESEYFLAMVQENRAGSIQLKKHFSTQMHRMREEQSRIASRVQAERPLTGEQATRYYSKWTYSAVHIAVLLKEFRTIETLADNMGISRGEAREAVDFLLVAGLLIDHKGTLEARQQRVHLDRESPLIRMHHINWRLRAIQALEKSSIDNLHYSGVLAVTTKAADKIRKLVLKLIEDVEPALQEPNEEELHCLSLDFFPVSTAKT